MIEAWNKEEEQDKNSRNSNHKTEESKPEDPRNKNHAAQKANKNEDPLKKMLMLFANPSDQ